MSYFSIWVDGIPAPQGSKSYKGMYTDKTTGKSRARLVESSKKLPAWREAVTAAATAALADGWSKISGPVTLTVDFWLPAPKSAPKRRPILPAVPPDLSKLMRAVEDALTVAGVWEDDARVVDAVLGKRYAYPDGHPQADGTTPGARITIRETAP